MLTKQKYYLITSANELTWKFDRPVVFLGDWCRLYDRKHIWQDMDAVVAKPYGLGEFKKDTDYSKVKKLEETLFTEFYEILNQQLNKKIYDAYTVYDQIEKKNFFITSFFVLRLSIFFLFKKIKQKII